MKKNLIKKICILSAMTLIISGCNNISSTEFTKLINNNTIDLGYKSNNSVSINLNFNNSFKTKTINNGFTSEIDSINHFKIALLRSPTTLSLNPEDIFNDSQSIKFNLPNTYNQYIPLNITNLKPDSYYYLALRAYSSSDDSVNITSYDGTVSGEGGGTEGTINTGSGREYLFIDSAGQLSVINDGTSVKGGLNTSANNRIDIELQLMKSTLGAITNNNINFSPGNTILPPLEMNLIPNNKKTAFMASTDKISSKSYPDVAGSINENFLITWVSDSQDGDGEGIFAQLYNKDNLRIDNEFQVNLTTTSNQTKPKVAMTNSGKFIITWQSDQAGDNNIYAKIYGSGGEILKEEFIVNSNTTGEQVKPQIAVFNDESFVITWEDDQGSDSDIYFRKFDISGNEVISDNLVHEPNFNFQRNPSVSVRDNTGEFLITWEHDRNNLIDGSTDIDIMAKRFTVSGSPINSEFLVSEENQMYNTEPLALYNNSSGLNSDTFKIAWSNKDGSEHYMYIKSYNINTGNLKNEKFSENLSGLAPQSPKTISIDEKNNSLVAWIGNNESYFKLDYFSLNSNLNIYDEKYDIALEIDEYSLKSAYAKNKYIITWIEDDGNQVKAKVLNNMQ